MVEKLLGHWKLEKNENFDEFMKATKVNILLRKVGNSITSYEETTKNGDTWTINVTSTFKNIKLVFKIGEPFIDRTLDGKTIKTIFTIEGDMLVGTQEIINKGDVPARFERVLLEDGRMLMTCISLPDKVTAKRYFVRYNP